MPLGFDFGTQTLAAAHFECFGYANNRRRDFLQFPDVILFPSSRRFAQGFFGGYKDIHG
jgi:hypothetical protein